MQGIPSFESNRAALNPPPPMLRPVNRASRRALGRYGPIDLESCKRKLRA